MADLEQRIKDLATAAGTECKAIRTLADGKATVVQLTQAQYDALPAKDSATLYVIVG